jgi:hypothetical protein
MNPTTLKIRRALAAMSLSVVGAVFLVPLAHAGNTTVDDWFRDAKASQPQAAPQPLDLTGDYMFQQYFRNQANASDHIIDVSARDAVLVPASVSSDHILDVSARDDVQAPSSTPDLRGDYLFQQYFRDQATASDHILDVSSRDARAQAADGPSSTNGTDWQKIGIGVGLTLGGALALVVLVAVGLEVRHTRHRLGSA